ncbi:circadian clock-controlled protein daywake [Condylostylus longicornis]|uniref:circadian clock-controlled protein daywake n=1 Tax=Condylostylus longicornis TaxID=2530218 RepID=UPI00244DB088|nr:circadian clock-controlled protein daywake [Condylostylus longicornis]
MAHTIQKIVITISVWYIIVLKIRRHNIIIKGFVETTQNLPSYLNICKRSEPNIDDCVWKSIDKLRPYLISGIPTLNIPPMEPLLVPLVKVDQSVGPIYVKSQYNDVKIMGTSKFVVEDLKMNFDDNSFSLQIYFPTLNITSDYSITGKILIMPIIGKGALNANFTDVVVTSVLSGERFKKNNTNGIEEEYFRVTDVKVHFKIGGSNTHLDNLFNGDPRLGNSMNKFLNDNWHIIAYEIKPILEEAISEMIKELCDDFFNNYSYDVLFPK